MKRVVDLAIGPRTLQWWLLAAVAFLYCDHLGILEIEPVIEGFIAHPQDLVGIVALLGGALAALRNQGKNRHDD